MKINNINLKQDENYIRPSRADLKCMQSGPTQCTQRGPTQVQWLYKCVISCILCHPDGLIGEFHSYFTSSNSFKSCTYVRRINSKSFEELTDKKDKSRMQPPTYVRPFWFDRSLVFTVPGWFRYHIIQTPFWVWNEAGRVSKLPRWRIFAVAYLSAIMTNVRHR